MCKSPAKVRLSEQNTKKKWIFFHLFLVFSRESTFDRQVKVTIKLREMQENSEEFFFSPLCFLCFWAENLCFRSAYSSFRTAYSSFRTGNIKSL